MTKQQLADYISSPLFADRPSLEEAFAYAQDVAQASDNPPAVMTALMVVVNTIANAVRETE